MSCETTIMHVFVHLTNQYRICDSDPMRHEYTGPSVIRPPGDWWSREDKDGSLLPQGLIGSYKEDGVGKESKGWSLWISQISLYTQCLVVGVSKIHQANPNLRCLQPPQGYIQVHEIDKAYQTSTWVTFLSFCPPCIWDSVYLWIRS